MFWSIIRRLLTDALFTAMLAVAAGLLAWSIRSIWDAGYAAGAAEARQPDYATQP